MKNQNDLIVMIVAFVVLIGAFCGTYFTMPQVTKPASPEPVNLATPQTPTGVEPVMANSLPGGSGNSNSGASSAGGGPGAGKMGMGGASPQGKQGYKGPQTMGGMG